MKTRKPKVQGAGSLPKAGNPYPAGAASFPGDAKGRGMNSQAKRRVRTQAPPMTTAIPAYTDRVSLHDLIVLIAERVRARHHGYSIRQTRDKVRKRIAYAVKKGELLINAGNFEFGRAAAWAQAKWPGEMTGFPNVIYAGVATIGVRGLPATAKKYVVGVEGEQQRKIEALCEENERLRNENERLRPLAEKYQALRERNRRSARHPRK